MCRKKHFRSDMGIKRLTLKLPFGKMLPRSCAMPF